LTYFAVKEIPRSARLVGWYIAAAE